MVDKKTVAIAVMCVVTVLCLGLWANEAQEANRLEGELWELEDDYNKLALVRTSLEENYSELRTEKEDLEKDYSDLEVEYSLLKEDYLEVKSIIDTGTAIAKSAEWISEDECLKGTSEVIITRELWIWGIYLSSTHTVRVNITNIGDKPIGKVYIFLFPYTNGEFTERYDSNIVESLYIGETYSHDFRVSEDMTSYKVLAVTG